MIQNRCPRIHTSPAKEFICSPVELEDAAVHRSKDVLKFRTVFEGSFVPIKPWKSSSYIGVCGEKRLEYIAMLARELRAQSES